MELRNFKADELIFDEAETKSILKFFFHNLGSRIDTAQITNEIKSFAQALLIEAIDATYSLGYIKIVWQSSYNPGQDIKIILRKIAVKSVKHWFKHATQKDLLTAKISLIVRDKLANHFCAMLAAMLDGVALNEKKDFRSAMLHPLAMAQRYWS